VTEFKKPVPADRTIVDGIWTDILDDWSSSFLNDESGTHQKVNISNPNDFLVLLAKSLIESESKSAKILEQMQLLNMRFEEVFETKLDERDL